MGGNLESKTLYGSGWHQGTIFAWALPSSGVVLGANGQPEQRTTEHSLWVVATQDCDLDGLSTDVVEPVVEVRPVYETGAPTDRGIRSRKLLLSSNRFIQADSPRTHVSPQVLSQLAAATREPALDDDRARALKTWLGLRYDRPALPPRLVDVAVAISKAVSATRSQELADVTHDVLMQFTDDDPPGCFLWAVVMQIAPRENVQRWMASAGLKLDPSLGHLQGIKVVTKAELPLELIEESYAADLTKITWRPEGPVGAE